MPSRPNRKFIVQCACAAAMLLAAGMVVAQPGAMRNDATAQPTAGQPGGAAPGQPPGAAPGAEVSDRKLNQFIVAFAAVRRISDKFASRLNNVDDPSKAHEMQQKAQSAMVDAVEDTGLSVSDYNRIADRMDSDPELRRKVLENAEQN